MAGRSAVGIAIDAGVVQAVELAAEGERLIVCAAACELLPPDAFVEGRVKEAAAIGEVVARALRHGGMPARNVCIALGGPRTLARIVPIPAASVAEAEQILQERIARYAIYEDLDVTWRAAPLEGEAEEPQRGFVAASAVRRDVDLVLPALRRTGVFAVRLEPLALATLRALAASASQPGAAGAAAEDPPSPSPDAPPPAPPPTILLSLRNESADFLIVKGARPLLVRSVAQGGYELSLRPDAVDDLLVEARRAVEFCRTRFPDDPPRLWICVQATEGRAAVPVLEARLREGLAGIEVRGAPDWPDLAAGATVAEGAEQAWAAVGAAMVGLARDEAIQHLNLVPPEWPEMQRVQKHLVGFAATISLTILATAAATTTVRLTVGDTAKQAHAASIQMQANTTDVKTAALLKRRAAEAVGRARLWKTVRASVRPFDWVAGLDGVLRQIPEGVRVREVQCRRGTLRILGEAHSADLVHAFVRRLALDSAVEEANIERLVRLPGSGDPWPSYTITCRFRAPAPGEADPVLPGQSPAPPPRSQP
jgi:Tfp pilus assembly PilM family ATPase